MEFLQTSPVGCSAFTKNPFKEESCKNCGKDWTFHKGVIDDESLRRLGEKRRKKEADSKAKEDAAKAKDNTFENRMKKEKEKKKEEQKDSWYHDGQDNATVESDDDGFQMQIIEPTQKPVEPISANKTVIRNLLDDFDQMNVADPVPASSRTPSFPSKSPSPSNKPQSSASQKPSNNANLAGGMMGSETDAALEIEVLRAELRKAQKDTEAAQFALEDQTIEFDVMKGELEELRLKASRESVKSDVNTSPSELEDTLRKKDEEIEGHKNELKRLRSVTLEAADKGRELEEKQAEVDSLQAEVTKLRKIASDTDKDDEIFSLRKQLEEALKSGSIENHKLKTEISQLNATMREKDVKMEMLQEDLNELQANANASKNESGVTDAVREELEAARSEGKKAAAADAIAEIGLKDEEIQGLKKKLEDANSTLTTSQKSNEVGLKDEEIQGLKKKLEDANSALTTSQKSNEALEEKLRVSAQKISEVESSLREVESRKKEIESSVQKLEEDIASKTKTIDELQDALSNTRGEAKKRESTLRKETITLKEKSQQREEELSTQINAVKRASEARLSSIQKEHEVALATTSADIQSKESNVASLNAEIQAITKSFDEKERSLCEEILAKEEVERRLNEEIGSLTRSMEERDREFANEISLLQQNIDSLKREAEVRERQLMEKIASKGERENNLDLTIMDLETDKLHLAAKKSELAQEVREVGETKEAMQKAKLVAEEREKETRKQLDVLKKSYEENERQLNGQINSLTRLAETKEAEIEDYRLQLQGLAAEKDKARDSQTKVQRASTVMIEKLSAQQSEELEELREAARLNQVSLEKAEAKAIATETRLKEQDNTVADLRKTVDSLRDALAALEETQGRGDDTNVAELEASVKALKSENTKLKLKKTPMNTDELKTEHAQVVSKLQSQIAFLKANNESLQEISGGMGRVVDTSSPPQYEPEVPGLADTKHTISILRKRNEELSKEVKILEARREHDRTEAHNQGALVAAQAFREIRQNAEQQFAWLFSKVQKAQADEFNRRSTTLGSPVQSSDIRRSENIL